MLDGVVIAALRVPFEGSSRDSAREARRGDLGGFEASPEAHPEP